MLPLGAKRAASCLLSVVAGPDTEPAQARAANTHGTQGRPSTARGRGPT